MNRKLVCGLAICLVVPWAAGCATAPGVVRGQSPANGPDAASAAPQNVPPGGAPGSTGAPGGTCPPGGQCAPSDISLNCVPHHEFFYHYTGPEKGCPLEGTCLPGCCCMHNGCVSPYADCLPDCLTNRGPLVYPQNPTPGALVQYPYYVCKGPDDFFFPAISQAPR